MSVHTQSLLAMLRAGSCEEMADVLGELDRGMAIWTERRNQPLLQPPPLPSAPTKHVHSESSLKLLSGQQLRDIYNPLIGRPLGLTKSPDAPNKRTLIASILVYQNEAPTEASYRVQKATIRLDRCLARRIVAVDKRWSTHVHSEGQCAASTLEGHDLCTSCINREAEYDKAVKRRAHGTELSKKGRWSGRITEEPYHWQHMLGTEWANKKKPVFTPSEEGQGGQVMLIGLSLYMVKSGDKVYEYTDCTEAVGAYIGRLRADGTIASVPE